MTKCANCNRIIKQDEASGGYWWHTDDINPETSQYCFNNDGDLTAEPVSYREQWTQQSLSMNPDECKFEIMDFGDGKSILPLLQSEERRMDLLDTTTSTNPRFSAELRIGINGQSALKAGQLFTFERMYKHWENWRVKLAVWLVRPLNL